MDASEPYFAVGEYWDSLSYTYGEMDHNQDAHRQRIIDWINATSGAAGAFDVTTKGILHAVSVHLCKFYIATVNFTRLFSMVLWIPVYVKLHQNGIKWLLMLVDSLEC